MPAIETYKSMHWRCGGMSKILSPGSDEVAMEKKRGKEDTKDGTERKKYPTKNPN